MPWGGFFCGEGGDHPPRRKGNPHNEEEAKKEEEEEEEEPTNDVDDPNGEEEPTNDAHEGEECKEVERVVEEDSVHSIVLCVLILLLFNGIFNSINCEKNA